MDQIRGVLVPLVLCGATWGLGGCSGKTNSGKGPDETMRGTTQSEKKTTGPDELAPRTPVKEPVSPAPSALAALDLTPGGLCLTMDAPNGATVKPAVSGVEVHAGEGFGLRIHVEDGRDTDERRKQLRQPGMKIVRDEKDVLVAGRKVFDEESFQLIVRVTVEGKSYRCVDDPGTGLARFTEAQAVRMASCAQTLRQTPVNKQAETRMQQAIARLKKLDCRCSPSLNHVELEGEQLRDRDLALLKDVPQIATLDISSSQLTPSGLKHLHALPNLVELNLHGDGVTDAWLASLKSLRLRYLWLDATKVSSAGWQHLHALPTLRKLSIMDQPVEDGALRHLGKLTTVTELGLVRTGTGDAGLRHLGTLTQLQKLRLNGNPVTDAGLEHLVGLTKLTQLGLTETKVTAAGVEKLKKVLPECEVVRGSK